MTSYSAEKESRYKVGDNILILRTEADGVVPSTPRAMYFSDATNEFIPVNAYATETRNVRVIYADTLIREYYICMDSKYNIYKIFNDEVTLLSENKSEKFILR